MNIYILTFKNTQILFYLKFVLIDIFPIKLRLFKYFYYFESK